MGDILFLQRPAAGNACQLMWEAVVRQLLQSRYGLLNTAHRFALPALKLQITGSIWLRAVFWQSTFLLQQSRCWLPGQEEHSAALLFLSLTDLMQACP